MNYSYLITNQYVIVISDSIDCVALLNEEHFFTGSNDSSLGVWSINKKKPILIKKNAHNSTESGNQEQTSWIISVAALHNTDLLASGNIKLSKRFHFLKIIRKCLIDNLKALTMDLYECGPIPKHRTL